MPEYQWKLTIVERNLLLSNWMRLIPEAQERMLEEADQLIADLPLSDRQRLMASLGILQQHTEKNLQKRIMQILSPKSSKDIINVLEFNVKNNNLSPSTPQVNSVTLVKSIN